MAHCKLHRTDSFWASGRRQIVPQAAAMVVAAAQRCTVVAAAGGWQRSGAHNAYGRVAGGPAGGPPAGALACTCPLAAAPRSRPLLPPDRPAGQRVQLQPAQRGAFRAAALRRVAAAPRRRAGACGASRAIRPRGGWAVLLAEAAMRLQAEAPRPAPGAVGSTLSAHTPPASSPPLPAPFAAPLLQLWQPRHTSGSGRTPSLLPKRWRPSPTRRSPLWRRRG